MTVYGIQEGKLSRRFADVQRNLAEVEEDERVVGPLGQLGFEDRPVPLELPPTQCLGHRPSEPSLLAVDEQIPRHRYRLKASASSDDQGGPASGIIRPHANEPRTHRPRIHTLGQADPDRGRTAHADLPDRAGAASPVPPQRVPLGGQLPPDDWRLAAHFRVNAAEIPGSGGSQRVARAWGFAHEADWAADLLDALDLKRDLVLGHSDTGGVATVMGVRHPDRLDGLVLADSVGARPGATWATLLRGRICDGVFEEARLNLPLGPHLVANLLRHPRNCLYHAFRLAADPSRWRSPRGSPCPR